MRQFVLPALFTIATGAMALSSTQAAPARGEVAIAFPPFTSELAAWDIVRAAGGSIVAPTRIPSVVVAFSPDDGFQDRARRLGALLFFNASGLCAPLKDTPK